MLNRFIVSSLVVLLTPAAMATDATKTTGDTVSVDSNDRMVVATSLGRRIRTIRRARGMSQRAMAEAMIGAGVPAGTVLIELTAKEDKADALDCTLTLTAGETVDGKLSTVTYTGDENCPAQGELDPVQAYTAVRAAALGQALSALIVEADSCAAEHDATAFDLIDGVSSEKVLDGSFNAGSQAAIATERAKKLVLSHTLEEAIEDPGCEDAEPGEDCINEAVEEVEEY